MNFPNGIKFTLSAPGKVILHGEHSAVYSKLALAASLGLRTSLTFQENAASDLIEVSFPDINFHYSFKLAEIQNLLEKPLPTRREKSLFSIAFPEEIDHDVHLQNMEGFLRKDENYQTWNDVQKHSLVTFLYLLVAIYGSLSVQILPFQISITSQLTIGAGTGSSASFAVCLSATMVYYLKILSQSHQSGNLSKEGYAALSLKSNSKQFDVDELVFISNWGYNGEKIHHGNPSGIDNTVCTYGSLVAFRKGCPPERKEVGYPIKLMLINTKVSRNTKTLVAKVGDLMRKYPSIITNVLDAMDNISKKALTCVDQLNGGSVGAENNFEAFETLGDLAEMNHGLLSVLGVSHSSLENIIGILRNHGLKGKLTGAGGGGYAICLVPPQYSEAEVEKVLGDLQNGGYDGRMTTLGDDGIRVDA